MKTFFLLICLVFLVNDVNSKKVPFRGDKVAEMCVACRFIWENITEALADPNDNFLQGYDIKSSRRNPILISQSFQYFCQISPDIFYDPCNAMFEKLFFMSEDFISGKDFNEICLKNDFC